MKIKNIFVGMGLSLAIVLSGCSASSTTKGALIGGAGGAAVGAGVGALVSKNKTKGALIGAAAGAAVGTTAGLLIGKKMDKKKKELAAIEAAKIEDATDVNGLQSIKVTFDSGILFSTNSSTLSAASKTALDKFAAEMGGEMAETNINVFGHTDNTGSYEVNQKVSTDRANAVLKYLESKGVASSRLTSYGLSYDDPIADNSTAAGRAQNRRVEIYISANQKMIEQAEAEASK